MNRHVKEISLLAIATSVLIVQEMLLSFLPNIQLTTLLILVYTSVFGFQKTSIIVTVHVIIDNLLYGSIGMLHVWIPMLIGWQLIVILFYLLSQRTKNIYVYAITGYLFGHLYGMIFVPFQALLLSVDPMAYLIADLPFQVIMGLTNLLTIIWLYEVLTDFLKVLYSRYIYEKKH